jgi:hypothetical protein
MDHQGKSEHRQAELKQGAVLQSRKIDVNPLQMVWFFSPFGVGSHGDPIKF